jgi:hypothetical protein
MSAPDLRGNPCGTASAAARDHAERALWRMMSFYDTPLADLDAAAQADPQWALPPLMKAGFLLSLTEPALVGEAAAQLAAAQALEHSCTPRERAHLQAVAQVLEGRWTAACRTWDELLLDHPCDALALQWAHLWDFYRGDAPALRQRPARVLPEWDEADPLYAHVLALHAFGLEECNLYPQAEETGRRALQIEPRVPWAVHAVAHVMEMQGRCEEGAVWLRQHQAVWAEGNGFAGHLWRLHLLGQDVQAAARALADTWPLDDAHAGYYAFNDVHAMAALLAAGEVARAESWLARCAQRAMAADDARRVNHAMAREVGLPLMRGLLALTRGDADGAADLIHPVRGLAQRFGGHAQRDLIDQTLLAAAARGSRRALGRALLNERLLAKAATPLTRHWAERVGGREAARA